MALFSKTSMRIEVDVDESIRKGRLAPVNLDLDRKIGIAVEICLYVPLIAFLIGLPSFAIVRDLVRGTVVSIAEIIIFTIFIVPGIWLLHGAITNNRLRMTTGQDLETNKAVMLEILKAKFPRMGLFAGDNLISGYRGATLFSHGVRLFVFFEDDRVYVTISRFNHQGLKSLFHSLYADRVTRSLLSVFNDSLAAGHYS